jgi:hypothetical protein
VEASNVTLSERMTAKLTPKRKRELRRELALAYISKKPYGKRLKANELLGVTDLTTAGGAHIYLQNLVRDGYLTKHELGPRSAFYVVNEPVTTLKSGQLVEYTDEPPVIAPPAAPSLEEQAMRFGWEHPLYNNDLREFIKWLKEQK